jgi:hypothetical protein
MWKGGAVESEACEIFGIKEIRKLFLIECRGSGRALV